MDKTVWIDLPGGPQPYSLPEDSAEALKRAQAMADAQAPPEEEVESEEEEDLEEGDEIETLFSEGLLPVPPELFADLLRSGEIQIIQTPSVSIPMGVDVAQYF